MVELPEKESLQVEFKSDKDCYPDKGLVEVVVGMANTQGGEIYLGVEDDGTPTGLHPRHRDLTGIAAAIGNRTIPPLAVRTAVLDVGAVKVARIEVRQSRTLIATSDGKFLRRRLMLDNSPETVGMSPAEITQRLSTLRLVDPSAQPLGDATITDLDPVERERLRNIISQFNGEKLLLELADEEIDGALGFTTEVDGVRYPTLTGLLCIGRESSLRRLVPTHEAAFQVLEGTEVRVNDFYRGPLLKVIEQLLDRFDARNEEQEIQVGMYRLPVPDFDRRGFREAIVNAFAHRDYARMGTVFVRLTKDALTITNPGGFVEGVNLNNLLTVQPIPRNPFLADALKRIGLAERTGRGVDRIYEGMLRYGRPIPDYSESNTINVVLHLAHVNADLGFMKMLLQEKERSGNELPVDSLIVLDALHKVRRLGIGALACAIQQPENRARTIVEQLVDAGLVEAHGNRGGRTYTLSAQVYRSSGDHVAYVRQMGFDAIQQEQMILKYIESHGKISRAEAMELCHIGKDQAYRIIVHLVKERQITKIGSTRDSSYVKSKQ